MKKSENTNAWQDSQLAHSPQDSQLAYSPPWRMMIFLFALNLLNYLDRYVLAGVLPKIEAEFAGITKQQLGYLAPAFLVVYMLVAPAFGVLGDKYPRRFLISIGVFLWSLATAAAGMARTFLQLFCSRMFVGIGEAAYGTTAPTIIADLFAPGQRGRALSFFYIAIPVGSALGYLCGGLLGGIYSWRAAFLIVGLPGLLLGALALRLTEPQRGCTEDVSSAQLANFLKQRRNFRDYLVLTRCPSYVLNTLGMTAYTYALGGISFWMPTFLAQERQLDLLTANFWFGLITVGTGLVGTLAGGALADRLARRQRGSYFLVSGVTMLLALPFIHATILSHDPTKYWITLIVAELLMFMNTGPSNTIIVNVTLPNMRTTAFALNIFIIHALGDVLSPVIMGRVADQRGLSAAFIGTEFAIVLGGIFWLAGTKFLASDMANVTARIKQ